MGSQAHWKINSLHYFVSPPKQFITYPLSIQSLQASDLTPRISLYSSNTIPDKGKI